MKRASITEAKSQLSRLIDAVKDGESVLITEHGEPVAQLVPIPKAARLSDKEWDAVCERLVAEGVLLPSERPPLTREELSALGPPIKAPGANLSQAVIEERDEDYRTGYR